MADKSIITHKAIPTQYKGINFRSRLEATWASFFDNLGWKWDYEPCDFNGWIPDFVLYGKELVFVEVKPVVKFPEGVGWEIVNSGCLDECLIVGINPFISGDFGGICIGWLNQECFSKLRGVVCDCWAAAPWGCWVGTESEEKNPDKLYGFCHEDQSFSDRITGCYDGGCFGSGEIDHVLEMSVKKMWNKAKNETQWKKVSG